MKVFSRVLTLLLASIVVSSATGSTALAGGISVFSPMAPQYTLGGFSYTAPSGDGWREVSSSVSMFHLVYAENLGGDSLNTRVDVVAEAFEIPDAALVTDVVSLAQQSKAQQRGERGDSLIAFSRIAAVPGADHVYSYSFQIKAGEQELHEIFFVVLARDKSEYFVAKVTTQEADYVTAPYFTPLRSSMVSLTHSATQPAPVPDKE